MRNASLAVVKKPEKYSLDKLSYLQSLDGFLFIIFCELILFL